MAAEKRGGIGPSTEVSVAELAALLDMSADRIYQLIRSGTLRTVKRGRLLLGDSLQRYIGSRTKVPVTEDEQKMERARQMAEVQLKASKAKIASLEADELEGVMHRSEDVSAMTEDLIYAIRSALMALPGRLAVDAAQTQTAAEAAVVIRTEVFQLMQELARYRYDPQKYQERVRERKKWEADRQEDDYDEQQ